MEIRFLDSNDGAAFWELRLEGLRDQPEAFGSSYQETLTRPVQARLEQFQQNVANPDKCIIGAWANGKVSRRGRVAARGRNKGKAQSRNLGSVCHTVSTWRGNGSSFVGSNDTAGPYHTRPGTAFVRGQGRTI